MISLPNLPKVIKKEGNKALFQIEAFYPGYGVTIGNSLRRVLFSSLQGAAVTQMKIKGVSHEFSTIPGIIEDVITIMLNVKQMRFKLYSDEPQKAILKVKGEKEVKGIDFKISPEVELINKDCHIATLTTKSVKLEIEIQIEKGVGYSSRESRRKIMVGAKEKLGIGVIPIDAIFTPVKKVSYHVENMRVGKRTDFDRLLLEVETDGTITPGEAFSEASEILVKHFSLFARAEQSEAKRVDETLVSSTSTLKQKSQKKKEKKNNKTVKETTSITQATAKSLASSTKTSLLKLKKVKKNEKKKKRTKIK